MSRRGSCADGSWRWLASICLSGGRETVLLQPLLITIGAFTCLKVVLASRVCELSCPGKNIPPAVEGGDGWQQRKISISKTLCGQDVPVKMHHCFGACLLADTDFLSQELLWAHKLKVSRRVKTGFLAIIG